MQNILGDDESARAAVQEYLATTLASPNGSAVWVRKQAVEDSVFGAARADSNKTSNKKGTGAVSSAASVRLTQSGGSSSAANKQPAQTATRNAKKALPRDTDLQQLKTKVVNCLACGKVSSLSSWQINCCVLSGEVEGRPFSCQSEIILKYA